MHSVIPSLKKGLVEILSETHPYMAYTYHTHTLMDTYMHKHNAVCCIYDFTDTHPLVLLSLRQVFVLSLFV